MYSVLGLVLSNKTSYKLSDNIQFSSITKNGKNQESLNGLMGRVAEEYKSFRSTFDVVEKWLPRGIRLYPSLSAGTAGIGKKTDLRSSERSHQVLALSPSGLDPFKGPSSLNPSSPVCRGSRADWTFGSQTCQSPCMEGSSF